MQSYSSRPGPGAKSQPIEPRFWTFIEKDPEPDGCWWWRGGQVNGYGSFSVNGQQQLTHRVSFELAYGPVPEGMHVCHSCDDRHPAGDMSYRLCVNPAHLYAATNAQNRAHSVELSRHAHGERSHAPKGVDCHSAVVTSELVRSIRERYASGSVTQATLAAEYNVSARAISKIILRQSWKHIT
jgi:hypothetical protein